MNNEPAPSDERRKLTRFEREEGLVNLLLARLGQLDLETCDPNAGGTETGVDVTARRSDGRTIGIQVTEIDPFTEPGSARARERAIAVTASDISYGMWAQNDPATAISAFLRTVKRKVNIAENHSFDGYDEVWLLVCAGVPERGAAASTSIPTRQISARDLDAATDNILQNSKYKQCFLHTILGSEPALYRWGKTSLWHKAVGLEDISDSQSSRYFRLLKEAAGFLNHQEIERLTDEECQKVLD